MKRLPPDAYALGGLALAIAGEWFVPVNWLPTPGLTSPLSWLGALLAIAGIALEATAGRALTQAATTVRPYGSPSKLVTTGPFALSRNPLYVAMLMLLAGVALAFSLEWGLVLLPVLWLCLDRLVVPHEESALREAFGAAFDSYAATVRRWL